ncbi:MAG: WD40 repeat domain-containing protein [Candidatus Lokiarchaeia archaeon]
MFALSGSGDKTIRLWNVETGECIKTSEAHKSGVGSICFSPNGGFALSGGWDNNIKLWIFDWECDF